MKKILTTIIITVIFITTLSINIFAMDYVVQQGDTLWLIAQKHNVSVDDLIAANPQITDSGIIYVGQVIKIPTQESGTSPTPPVVTNKESLTYLYGGTTISYLKIIDNSKNSIKTINPDYFDINPDGTLLITPSDKINKDFITEMHNRGILVVPFISNHWDRDLGVIALRNREALSTQIAQMIEKYNLDGINIDIENVNEQCRQDYVEFTRLIKEKLPSNKIVTVAVAANPKGWTLGWHGSYDYKALSQYSDYLMIMAYDESYHGGPAGPVSSSGFFESSIKYAFDQGVPKEKIVTGIPFFGRYWKSGEAVGGIGITANDIEFLIANYESTSKYDTASQSANVVVTIKPDDPKPKIWGGRVLTEGVYNIWYDNVTSVKYKLDVINRYGINGVGSWALGQENIAIWDFYSSILNGAQEPTPEPNPTPNPDESVPSAPNRKPKPDKPSRPKVTTLIDIIEKNSNEKLINNSILTRGEVAILLSELTYLAPETNGDAFNDIKDYAGEGQINALKRRQVLAGTNGKFNPNKNITRGELAVMLDKILVLPDTIDFNIMPYNDISRRKEEYYSIAKLYYFGIIKGNSNSKFNPDGAVTVDDMALILDIIDYYKYPLNPNRQLEINKNKFLEPR